MKSFISILAVLIIVVFIFNIEKNKNTELNENKSIEEIRKRSGQKEEGEKKDNPAFVKLSVEETAALWQAYENTPKNSQLDNASDPWISMGPKGFFNRTTQAQNSKFSGKMLDVELTNQAFFRIGSANGGLWEQFLIGEPVCLSDGMTSQIIGAFASNFLNPDEIYAGTGEIWSNNGKSGTGVFKTTNKGVNWTNILPANSSSNLTAVSKVLYNPLYPEIVHITGSGNFNNYLRTTNGGTTWSKSSIGFAPIVSDLVINPLDPTILYAATWSNFNSRNIYKSTNSGDTWIPAGTNSGLPVGNLGNTTLALCNSQPNTLYALISNNASNLQGVYKTINGGDFWTRLNTPPNFDILNGQGFHANAITVSPANPNIVLAGGVFLIRSTNGGTTWDSVVSPGRGNPYVHADIQSFEWKETGTDLYMVNDGGLAVSFDAGVTFNTNVNSFPIAEVTYFDYSEGSNGFLAAGLEHNGIVMTNNGGVTWNMTIGGDGSGVAIHPTNPNYYYATLGVITDTANNLPFQPLFTTNAGINWQVITGNITNGCGQWYNQIRSSRNANDLKIYINICKKVYRSANNGANWTNLNAPTTTTGFIDNGFDVMPLTDQVFFSTTDSTTSNTGKVYMGLNQVWFDISPNIGNKVIQKVKPAFLITAVVRGATNSSNKVYRLPIQNFLTPTWRNVSGTGLSSYPLTDVQLDYSDTNRMIVGTQGWGCFITTNSGQNWYPWNEGLPKGIVVSEIKLIDSAQGEDYVLISTYGRGIFKRKLNAKVISVSNSAEILKQYELNQNYPNPFNPITTIKFNIPRKEFVKLSIYDINGREVSTLIEREVNNGIYAASFDGTEFSSGVYFYKLTTPSFTETKKMMLIK
jgi:photosystem II stability/assembly factor-like uncharacterized protein